MKNKKIILIGGCGLIGTEISKSLVKQNYDVIVIDKNVKKISKSIDYFKLDITKLNLFKLLIDKILKKYKTIDCVINCSYPKGIKWGENFINLKEKNLKENLFLQLGVPIIISKIFIKIFLKQKKGNLIFFSSVMGNFAPKFFHYEGTKMNSPLEYSAAKSGIIMITKYLSKLYGKKNIQINCISPGGIKDRQPKIFQNKYMKSCLIKGLLDPRDICGLVEFLISDKSRYINGQNIIIDDGWSL